MTGGIFLLARVPRRDHRRLRAVAICASMVVLSAIVGVRSTGASGPSAPSPSLSVRDFGAVGDGVTDDTAAIQRANDAVAAQGGGRVVFPAGSYVAMGVEQDSNVHFVGFDGATLLHPDGTTDIPIISGRTRRTVGSIQAGSRTLSVSSTRRFAPGAIVGVRGAGAPSAIQTATLISAVSATTGDFFISPWHGWRTNSLNLLVVGDEIIGYTGMSGSRLLNVYRGLFGSVATDHPAGTHVAQAQGLIARVVSVGAGTVELDRPAARGVTRSDVWVGVVNASVSHLTLDGNRPRGADVERSMIVALSYSFATGVRVANNTIRNVAHGAVTFEQGTTGSVVVDNLLWDNGVAERGWGSAIWLFRGAVGNTIENNQIGGASNYGLAIDDRTTVSTEWDASSDDNVVRRNTIDIPDVPGHAAVFVSGSNRNEIADNDVRSARRAILIARGTQGTNPGESEGNRVYGNRLTGHQSGLYVTGSYNRFEANVIALTDEPIVDLGLGNEFIANVVVPAPAASAPAPPAAPSPSIEPTPITTSDASSEPTPMPTVASVQRRTKPVSTGPAKLAGKRSLKRR